MNSWVDVGLIVLAIFGAGIGVGLAVATVLERRA